MKTEYTVKKGDTLDSIAKRYYGDESLSKEVAAYSDNAIPEPYTIAVGQKVVLPRLLTRVKEVKTATTDGSGPACTLLPLELFERIMSVEIAKIETTMPGSPDQTEANEDFTGLLGEKALGTIVVYGGKIDDKYTVRLDIGRLTNRSNEGSPPDVNKSFSLIARIEKEITVTQEPVQVIVEWDGKATETVAREFSNRTLVDVNTSKPVSIPVSDTKSGAYVPHGLYYIDQVCVLKDKVIKAKLRPSKIGFSVPMVANLSFNSDWIKDLEMFGIAAFKDEIEEALRRYGKRDYLMVNPEPSKSINIRFVTNKKLTKQDCIFIDIGGINNDSLFGLTGATSGTINVNLFTIQDWISGIVIWPGAYLDSYQYLGGPDHLLFRSIFGPMGVKSSTVGPDYVKADHRTVGNSANITGACNETDKANVKIILDKIGIPTVLSTNPEKVPPARQKAIQTALRAFIRLLGYTIVHELGHALGCVAEVSERNSFSIGTDTVKSPLNGGRGNHNKISLTNRGLNIMDDGSNLNFKERIEHSGSQVKFRPENSRYMQAVVPYRIPRN